MTPPEMADVPAAERAVGKCHIPYFLKVLCAVAAFALLLKLTDFTAMKGAIVRARLELLSAGLCVSVLGQFLASQRWRMILHSGAVDVPPLFAFRLNLIGIFFGNFLPGQGSGDLVKCGLLFSDYPDRRAFLIASVFYDRIIGLLSMVGVAAIASLLIGTTYDFRIMRWLGFTAVLGIIGAVVLLRLFSNFSTSRALPVRWRFGAITAFASEFTGLSGNLRLALRSLVLSVVFQLFSVLTLWLMLAAVMAAPPFLPVLLSAPLSILVAAVPISPGGLGVREGMFALIMHRFGLDGSAVAAAAVLGLLPLCATSIAGGLLFLLGKKNEARKDTL